LAFFDLAVFVAVLRHWPADQRDTAMQISVNEQIDAKVQRPALERAVGSHQAVKILMSIWLSF
jgi:hypothetical protein